MTRHFSTTKMLLGLLIATLTVVFTGTMTLALDKKSYSGKDPGIINKEAIVYWLTKRGELTANASDSTKQQALDKYLERTKNGGFQLTSLELKMQARLEAKRAELAQQQSLQLSNQTGTTRKSQVNQADTRVKIFAVLVDFDDLPYDNNRITSADTSMFYNDYSVDHYRQLIFSTTGYLGPNNQNLRSAYQYYQQVSGGSFFLEGDVFGWVRADNDAAIYGGNDPADDDNDKDPDALIKEAITKAIALAMQDANFDLSEYDKEDQLDLDNDGNVNEPDGLIDHISVFHSSIGEESGGGVLGDDAIWSHRGSITNDARTDYFNIPNTTYQGTTPYKAFRYTIQPLTAAIGVVVHEFGHDLGVADEYNTNDSSSGSPVSYWSLMASGNQTGSLFGTEPSGLSPLVSDFFQNKFAGNWNDTNTFTLAQLVAAPQTVTLTEAANHDAAMNLIKIDLPTTQKSPFSGTWQYHSDIGDNKNNQMSFDLNVPTSSNVELSMKAHWNIEKDWDYIRVLVNGTALVGNYTDASNSRHPTVSNTLSGISASIAGSTLPDGWVDLTFDLAAYQNQTITVVIEYVTDQSVGGYGFLVDDIKLLSGGTVVSIDDAETQGSLTLNGFNRIMSLAGDAQNYWIQLRSYAGEDSGLQNIYTEPNGYQKGMLVWFDDDSYSNNHVNLHPGSGFIGVVDAGQTAITRGTLGSTSAQISDATFSRNSVAAISEFSDSNDYSSPFLPIAGKVLPSLGLKFKIMSQDINSSSATIQLSASDIAWVAEFTNTNDFRTVTFSNQSAGTGTASASWDFGDGSAINTTMSPTHVYQTSGDFTVTLTMTTLSDNSVSVSAQTITIEQQLTGSYQAVVDQGTVQLTATAGGGSGVYNYSWGFGDSSGQGTGQNVNHTYAASGDYTVSLTITTTDQTLVSEQVLTIYISPAANFSVSTSNLVANFTNQSTGGDGTFSYAWDFGDSTSDTTASPNHTYSAAGTYTVELTITDGQSNTSMFSQNVTVSAALPPPPPPAPSSGGGGSTGLLILMLMLLSFRQHRRVKNCWVRQPEKLLGKSTIKSI